MIPRWASGEQPLPYAIPYCGAPPLPGELAARFNLDPRLIIALALLAFVHLSFQRNYRALAAAGWAIAAIALISPLCALSVSLFSARVGQHLILALLAAPLIAFALPMRSNPVALWSATACFFLALWFWHMPAPYAATFRSIPIYWAMHISLTASAICLWHGLLRHERRSSAAALAAGTVTSIHMGLLGALLTVSSHAWFEAHYLTTSAWGLSPLADQQLGGVLMWVPGMLFLLAAGVRSASLFLEKLEPARA